MQVNRDNTAIFSLLDTFDRLPTSFESSICYVFERDGCFFTVVYLVSSQKRDFILFSIEQFSLNFNELSDIMVYLLDLEIEAEQRPVIEDALAEIHAIIESGGTGTRFFDAH